MANSKEILAQIAKNGVALSNHWELIFDLPRNAFTNSTFRSQIDEEIFNASQRICVACEQIDIPGRLYPTLEHRIYQTRKKMPYGMLMEDVQATMRVSADMFERKFFEAWCFLIQDPITKNFNYYNDYTTNIDIYQRDQSGRLVYAIRLVAAYPFAVLQLNADQTTENQYYRQNVTFAYNHWIPIDMRDDLYTTNKASSISLPNPLNILKNIISI